MPCQNCPMTKISEAVSDAGMVKYGRIEESIDDSESAEDKPATPVLDS